MWFVQAGILTTIFSLMLNIYFMMEIYISYNLFQESSKCNHYNSKTVLFCILNHLTYLFIYIVIVKLKTKQKPSVRANEVCGKIKLEVLVQKQSCLITSLTQSIHGYDDSITFWSQQFTFTESDWITNLNWILVDLILHILNRNYFETAHLQNKRNAMAGLYLLYFLWYARSTFGGYKILLDFTILLDLIEVQPGGIAYENQVLWERVKEMDMLTKKRGP